MGLRADEVPRAVSQSAAGGPLLEGGYRSDRLLRWAAMSRLVKDCPMPARPLLQGRTVARARAGIGQSLTGAVLRRAFR